MLKAVIFDMDGVIIDSEPMHFKVDKSLLSKVGIEVDNSFLSRYVGVSNPEMFADIKEKFNIRYSINELLDLKSKLLLEALNETKLDAISGVRELIQDLTSHNILLAIASSSPRMFIEAVIKKLKFEQFFKVIVSGEELEKSKPAPDIFIKAAGLLGVERDECIVIEDASAGVEAAYAAGIKCIGFVNPNSGNQDLSKASVIVEDMRILDYNFICNILD
ncbi:MAG: HAD family phosphatase [Clostridiaceae bacterium]|nr:HAD family phosphatase [Clostridiaceae bacterium]